MSCIVALTDPRIPLPPAGVLRTGVNEAELLVGGMALLDLPRRLDLWSPDCPVVDIGCGDGRLAYGLLQKGQSAPYFGIDGASDQLRWLRPNLTRWLPDGSDIVEMQSEDDWTGTTLPWPAWQPGLVALHEILTRSLPHKLVGVLVALGERMPVGAAACVNLYLLNKESHELHVLRRADVHFVRAGAVTDPYATASGTSGSIAYDEGWFHAQAKEAGLRVETILYGGWCGRQGAFAHHDLAVLRRA